MCSLGCLSIAEPKPDDEAPADEDNDNNNNDSVNNMVYMHEDVVEEHANGQTLISQIVPSKQGPNIWQCATTTAGCPTL